MRLQAAEVTTAPTNVAFNPWLQTVLLQAQVSAAQPPRV
jgi:hypothetical protein